MIPGLENAKFVRHGIMHRNTFINSPDVLNRTLNLRKYPKVFFARQIVGVEGYVESAATGIIAAINVINLLENKQLIYPPRATVLGALLEYIETSSAKHFQPMNANYGVLASPLKEKQEIAKVSIETLKEWMDKHGV
jgi:methylenetetrahydrofolate--tRNA-(uracil-5-)-methyltransferase